MTEIPNCPEGHPMERRERMFYWRGDSRPGWVCPICNSLWSIPGDEITPLRQLRESGDYRPALVVPGPHIGEG
jgi:hypothetical protein